jgi:hypothetical protein
MMTDRPIFAKMSNSTEPTEIGKKKYPPDGMYEEAWACTCSESCPNDCKGECDCEACFACYCDAMDILNRC